MATTTKQTAYGSVIHLMTTELNSLASGAQIVSSVNGTAGVFDNSSNNDIWIDCRLTVQFGTGPVAYTTFDLYFLRLIDGTNAPTGATSLPQNQLKVGFFEVRTVTTAQLLDCYNVLLPPGKWQVVVYNATDQACASSGNKIDAYPHDMQNV